VNVTASSSDAPNFLAQAAKLHKAGVTHLHMIAGGDRADEYYRLLHKYNGVKGPHGSFNFKHIKVHSAGERDPDSEGVEGMSASKMREHAKSGNFKEFRKGVPSRMNDAHAKELYDHVRQGMGMKEDVNMDFEELLTEGVHDKSIFKAVFLGGGPGSGKDYVLDRTLSGQGLTEINSDKALEFLMDKNNLDMRMPDNEEKARNVVRGKAKNMTELKQRLALFGRNGLIINGTGDDVEKIAKIKERLEDLGYDTSMIMVNTDDEVSKQRNIERGQRGGRTVPEEIRKQKWDAVQAARPEHAKLFGQNYTEFDNSEDLRNAPPEVVQAKEKELMDLYKGVQKFVSKPPKHPSATSWVASELEKKDTLKIDPKKEVTPHEGSNAAEEARRMGLQYFGFGRYGQNGKVTHRSVHDKLVEVQPQVQGNTKMPVPGTSMKKVNEEFEELFAEDLRQWFDPKHPKGGWKRINSKGEAIGPCAREPGEAKPKCMSNAKRASLSKKERASAVAAKRRHDPNPERKGEPINVSNYGKGKLSESYSLSDSGALNLLLLGTRIDEVDFDEIIEEKKPKYLTDRMGNVRVFMLRRAAAKEAHQKNGTVYPYKNGYVVKLNENEENENVRIFEKDIQQQSRVSGTGLLRENTGTTQTRRSAESGSETQSKTYNEETSGNGQSHKITLAEIRSRQKEKVIESIDKGIEPGLSMATSGENFGRGATKVKQIKKPLEELTGDETTASIGAQAEDELKKKGINLSTFKSKKVI
jgi:hypothetical protein